MLWEKFMLQWLCLLSNDIRLAFTNIFIVLFLQINRLLLEDDTGMVANVVSEANRSEYQSLVKEFQAFLGDWKDVLDEATTMRLLER